MKKGNKKTNYNFSVIFTTLRDALREDDSSLHMPRGNDKTGSIPAFSLLPGATCSPDACAHCMQEDCYAIKNLFRSGYDVNKNSTFRAWLDNTVMAMQHVYALESLLDNWIKQNKPDLFRIHAAGDFCTVKYARMWRRLAIKNPNVRFLAFTKQFDIVKHVHFYKVSNFELVLSGWTGIYIPDDLRKHYRCAWCNDGIENRIPTDAIKCPGDCETCRACWNLSKLGKDSVFDKH